MEQICHELLAKADIFNARTGMVFPNLILLRQYVMPKASVHK